MPLTCGLSFNQKLRATGKYLRNLLTGKPLLVTIEMTQYCNAKCDFCNCWKTTRSPKLGDYTDMVRQLDPVVVALTGGEPTLRKDLPEVVRRIKHMPGYRYVYVVTNGSLLAERKARELHEAGLDHLSISLNYLGGEHDEERKIKGLYHRTAELIPKLTAAGMTVALNTVIMRENLAQIVPIAWQAYTWGAKVSYSCYTDHKNGNETHLIPSELVNELLGVVEELLRIKATFGHITNSAYYLRRVPEYFTGRGIPDCQSGRWFVQLTPDGYVRRCSDFEPECHYTEYRGLPKTDCTQCWYACRGETEASLRLERLVELVKWM